MELLGIGIVFLALGAQIGLRYRASRRPEVRPAERSVFERPAPLSKSAFQCFLRSCHTGCLASSDEKGGATNLARSTPPCAADPSGTLGTPAG